MTRLKLLILGVPIAVSTGVAHTEDKFSPGADVGAVEHPYKDYDANAYPVPVINYEDNNSWSHGLGDGYYLWNGIADKLSVTACWSSLHFKAEDSGDHQVCHLNNRRSTMVADLSYVHFTQYDYLCTTLVDDTLDNSNSIVWDMAWLYRYTNGGLAVTPSIGMQWSSENQDEHYYGVSCKESAHSSLRGYSPNDSWSPYLRLSTNYNFPGDRSVYGTARCARLSNEVTDDPMVGESWTGLISTGIIYKFW